MMHPGEWTEDDLLMLTEEKLMLMQEFGLITEHEVNKWHMLVDKIDFISTNYTYFDAQYC